MYHNYFQERSKHARKPLNLAMRRRNYAVYALLPHSDTVQMYFDLYCHVDKDQFYLQAVKVTSYINCRAMPLST